MQTPVYELPPACDKVYARYRSRLEIATVIVGHLLPHTRAAYVPLVILKAVLQYSIAVQYWTPWLRLTTVVYETNMYEVYVHEVFVKFSSVLEFISWYDHFYRKPYNYVDTGRPSGTCGRGLSSIRAL